jgi:hypothetical protein
VGESRRKRRCRRADYCMSYAPACDKKSLRVRDVWKFCHITPLEYLYKVRNCMHPSKTSPTRAGDDHRVQSVLPCPTVNTSTPAQPLLSLIPPLRSLVIHSPRTLFRLLTII